MAPHTLQYLPPGQLARYISNKHVVPPQARSTPWLDDGNIILITDKKAFKFYKRTLTSHSEEFQKKIEIMNDGNTDVVENCPVLEVPFASPVDLGHFLAALHNLETHTPLPGFSLATLDDFRALEGILRVATLTKTPVLRTRAIAALQVRYPTTLAGWDIVRPPRRLLTPPPSFDEDQDWEWDRTLIVNLAREVEAFSVLPAAMAMLTEDCSAGEVFGVRLPSITSPVSPPLSPMSPVAPSPFSPMSPNASLPRQRTDLNAADAPSFALLKEYEHRSLVSLLLTIRSLGSTCIRPPEVIPRKAGLAPVGSSLLLPGPSQCSGFFKETAARLLEIQVLENPVGYAQFLWYVLAVRQDRQRTCKYCWREFSHKCNEAREKWWEELPVVLKFEQGWADERLRSVEVDA
ncbi:hypothetical protein C0989_002994 [Termitomyces sp. Mn162]|nr:hypothetical protein C0989_002994 [Termitomyces sp. Mn162]